MIVSVALIAGIAVGILVSIAGMVMIMRKQMVVPERSSKSFDATCEAVESTVPGNDGWSFPIDSFDMSAKLAAKNGLPENIKRIRQYFLCKPSVARRVLGDTPKLSAIMPCSWSVYELSDGSVWISHMNIAMMAKMMGGTVGDAMAGVAAADARFLESILH